MRVAADAGLRQVHDLDFGAGGNVEVVDLPSVGIRGNSHMLMMDRNNLEIAALIQRWLERQGLYQESNADRRKQTGRRVLADPYLYP